MPVQAATVTAIRLLARDRSTSTSVRLSRLSQNPRASHAMPQP